MIDAIFDENCCTSTRGEHCWGLFRGPCNKLSNHFILVFSKRWQRSCHFAPIGYVRPGDETLEDENSEREVCLGGHILDESVILLRSCCRASAADILLADVCLSSETRAAEGGCLMRYPLGRVLSKGSKEPFPLKEEQFARLSPSLFFRP
ncbi:hypothetical protein CEXT_705931 [Caerostris extrusa]|uniref:Uncharacterized protein n=1 Tax=Caerostris extrusa TaxID=172846 RepID=A0AAV4Q1E6_CAEEX|nr:hypothetical protein CEXT_705931 [Caerostris extrusa]